MGLFVSDFFDDLPKQVDLHETTGPAGIAQITDRAAGAAEIANGAELPVTLSSNLNYNREFRDVIKAGPADMIISCSGYTQEIYRQTHTRGDVEVVKRNMRKLRAYMNEFNSPMTVRVVYHLYRHNLVDSSLMNQFAESLGIEFSPTLAFLQPLEKLADAMVHRTEDADRNVIDLMLCR